jgi:murein DD-endopeptidase MepM/ murein hydrolase activator NlpD
LISMNSRRALQTVVATAVISIGINVSSFAAAAEVASDLVISDSAPRQGETLEVTVKVPGFTRDPAQNAHFSGHPLQFHPEGENEDRGKVIPKPILVFHGQKIKMFASQGGSDSQPAGETTYRALLAVPADLDPGKYAITCGAEEKQLSVKSGLFPLQHISLPPAKDNFNMSPGEEEAVEGAKKTLSENRMWQGCFVVPSRARVSSGFGLKRMVNGRLLKDYFHSGIDYAAPLGSPVVACAPGTVVLVGQGFKLHGNVVAIDHGQGVISFYIHLHKILVTKGQNVKQGERIGLVGRTGRATGPHLHYSLYVNQVAANPNDWFKRVF